MRILLVQDTDWLERGPHQQHHLMDRLSLRGHEIRVIDYEISWKEKSRKEWYSQRKLFSGVSKVSNGSNVTVIRPGILELPLFDYFSIIFTHGAEIRRQITEFKPNVIIGMGILNTLIAMQMAKHQRIPFICYSLDMLYTLIPLRNLRFLGKILESHALRQCDILCVINEELKRYAISMGAQPDKIYVLRAGIDTARFNPRIDGQIIRNKFNIGPKDIVLFFMGWLYTFSGLKEVVLELVKSKETHSNVKLLIVGDGDLSPELLRIKKDYDLKQLVLAGRQPYEHIPEYIAASDICLLPAQKNEVMKNIVPIKMYEYMACGKPVIATSLGGVMKEFGVGNGVIYVDKPEDVLKEAMELANDRKMISEIGSAATRFVQQNSWEGVTDQFETLLRNAKQR